MTDTNHLTWEMIADHLESNTAESLSVYLDRCACCREKFEEVKDVLSRLEVASLESPPQDLQNRLLSKLASNASLRDRMARAWTAFRDSVASDLREIQASLMADSLTPSVGLRDATTAVPRLLLYQTEHHSISISLDQDMSENTITLLGQLTPRGDKPMPVSGHATLIGAGEPTTVAISQVGDFEVKSLVETPWELALSLGDELVRIRLMST